jgi:two-component system KDP operon response regulator KdpE
MFAVTSGLSGSQGTLAVLVIDDEPQIRRVVHNAFIAAPFSFPAAPGEEPVGGIPVRVLEAGTGRQGIDTAASEAPALVVLDLGLPDMPGIDVCREIRRWSSAPIIVLSARHADTEKAALLDAGADDYMTKPFSTVELLARVRAQLRRTRRSAREADENAVSRFGDVMVDPLRRRVERAGVPLHLTPTEWALLRTFVRHPRQTLTHRQLFHEVWGSSEGDAQQYLRVYVAHLRRKIEQDPVRPRFIRTDAGVGYRFEPDGTESA